MYVVNLSKNQDLAGIKPAKFWAIYLNQILPFDIKNVQIIFNIDDKYDLFVEYNKNLLMTLNADETHIRAFRLQYPDEHGVTFRACDNKNNYNFKNWLDYMETEQRVDDINRAIGCQQFYEIDQLKKALSMICDTVITTPSIEDAIEFVNAFAGPYDIELRNDYVTNRYSLQKEYCAGGAKNARYGYNIVNYKPNSIQKLNTIMDKEYLLAYYQIKYYQQIGMTPDPTMWVLCPDCGHYIKRTITNTKIPNTCKHCGSTLSENETTLFMKDWFYDPVD